MKTEIRKWGNSYAVRIPKPVAEAARVSEGTEVELRVPRPGKVEIEVARRKRKLADYVRRITPENLHTEVDWVGPAGREVW